MNWNDFAYILQKTIGVKEGSEQHKDFIREYNCINPTPRNYKATLNDPWCAIYASAMWHRHMDGWFPYECSCGKMVELAKGAGKFRAKNSTYGKDGWLLFYDWERDGSPDHVGFIIDIDARAGQYGTIEGNYANCVKERIVPMDDKRIYGLVQLEYSNTEVDDAKQWVTSNGIMKGDGTVNYWQNPPTREQLAVILKRFYTAT